MPKNLAPPELKTMSWDSAVLVCTACRKRSSGAKNLKTKELLRAAKLALRDLPPEARDAAMPRPRVLRSSCLGLCPKAATAIAVVGAGRAPRIAPVNSAARATEAVTLLLQRN